MVFRDYHYINRTSGSRSLPRKKQSQPELHTSDSMSDCVSRTAIERICAHAASYEVKYAEVDENNKTICIDIPLLSTCVHQANRGFVYTQGKTCVTLFSEALTAGFLKEDANGRHVVVLERPMQERGEGYETFLQYNLNKNRRGPSPLRNIPCIR